MSAILGAIRADGVIAQPASEAPISFLDVRDLARVAARVLTSDGHDGRTYALTGPAALSYAAAAEVFSRVLGREVRYVGLSDEQARERMRGAGLGSFDIDVLLGVSRAYRDGGAEATTDTVREITGCDATSLESFIVDHLAAFA